MWHMETNQSVKWREEMLSMWMMAEEVGISHLKFSITQTIEENSDFQVHAAQPFNMNTEAG